ncbi:MAG TPA: hypothetical protein VEF35_02100, partial [Candidatus Bathyarchaeia archaeon]|nr:hypothetical protein [Candidatus Bathyarchaeia archaeon]
LVAPTPDKAYSQSSRIRCSSAQLDRSEHADLRAQGCIYDVVPATEHRSISDKLNKANANV